MKLISKPDGTKTVEIPEAEYQQLKKDQDKLECLLAGGVDNWDFYSDSLKDGGYYERWYPND